MRQPNILVRFAGAPLIACLLIAGAALIIYGWYGGHMEWWLALAAAGAVFRTLAAVIAVRRYKAWAAEWAAMGRVGGAPPPAAKASPWKRASLTVGALIAIPVVSSQPAMQDNAAVLTALHWAWILLALYCLMHVIVSLWRGIGKRRHLKREAIIAKSLDDPITLAVGHSTDCPTRASAHRNLPDYCLQLIGRN